MTVTIYHNPKCGTSRNVLAMIRETGIEPERFVDPLRDLFGHWARKMKHRRSPFHPMLKMMEARVMGRLPSPEGNGLHRA